MPLLKSKTSERHKFQMYMDRTHFDELQVIAGYEDRSVASLIRQIVANFLRDNKVAAEEVNNRGNLRRDLNA